ncbi:hypothetical protein PVIIG_05931 [Plasmodium vivax India VII]|uniref:Variable surface protein n=1 Tax=Plasmodium vivax India VII TaxID=1077284 RepID=A0A0J9S2D7_PLAVI|nr:hypothetical protein PVIIG_05931 [Plasmodium vivax India VII]
MIVHSHTNLLYILLFNFPFQYNTANTVLKCRTILHRWDPGDITFDREQCFGFSQDYISPYNDTFTDKHCLQAQNYLSNVEESIEPQDINNGCKYFLYWLYDDVLKKNINKHKVLKIYQDVLTGYIVGSYNQHFSNYVSFFSEETIEKIIKLAEMYDHFHKFTGDIEHEGNKCNHAEECIGLYKKNIKVCEEGNDYDFCYELDNLKENYDTYMMSKEICPQLTRTLESYKLYNPALLIITPLSILLVISLSLFLLYMVNFILFQIYEYYTNIYSVYFKTKFLLN